MKPEEIEKLSLDELLRIADDPQITVPDGLADRLQDIASSALLAARGPEALDDQPRPAQAFGHLARWLWGAIPAVALASLAIALLVGRQSQGVYQDPAVAKAYSDLERAFSAISESLETGVDALKVSLDAFHEPFEPGPSTDDKQSLL